MGAKANKYPLETEDGTGEFIIGVCNLTEEVQDSNLEGMTEN